MMQFSLLLRCVTIVLMVMELSTSLVTAHDVKDEKNCFQNVLESTKNSFGIEHDKSPENIIDFVEDVIEYIIETIHSIFYPIPHHEKPTFNYDVTLVGFVNFADGIGRHPILFKECLDDSVNINFLSTRCIPPAIEDAQLQLPRLNPVNKADVGAVSILTDILADQAVEPYKRVPESTIKIAYTMFESTEIPKSWVAILNKKFDMAVVPDQFLVTMYKQCGVEIPIFVLPLPLMLEDFLAIRTQIKPQNPFVFGFSGGFWKRKNHIRVLEAFAAEYGNRTDFKLRLHGRFGEVEVIKALMDKIAELKLTNVELIVKSYSHEEYVAFFQSLDCYVSLSMGEGFSITPREALAAGKPCILTNNTGQSTICNSCGVRLVSSEIPVPAFYDAHYDNNYITSHGLDQIKGFMILNDVGISDDVLLNNDHDLVFRSGYLGYQYDCLVEDVRAAMRDMYEHYDDYQVKMTQGRKWARQYLHENLSSQYVNLVKPKSIVLGKENSINDMCLTTNSTALYKKYAYILGHKILV